MTVLLYCGTRVLININLSVHHVIKQRNPIYVMIAFTLSLIVIFSHCQIIGLSSGFPFWFSY